MVPSPVGVETRTKLLEECPVIIKDAFKSDAQALGEFLGNQIASYLPTVRPTHVNLEYELGVAFRRLSPNTGLDELLKIGEEFLGYLDLSPGETSRLKNFLKKDLCVAAVDLLLSI